ncbi:MAG: polysaccharide deacetylase family protein [Chloroflexi bacterium]|nr:polysaccharide deacetylase family protein [Chloroflexota bacterium]
MLTVALLLPRPAPVAAQTGWDEVSEGDLQSGMVALTFDAGSDDSAAASILDTLQAHHLHVTMFLTGQWAESYPDLTKRVAADGHELANHSYYHPDFTALSKDQILWELDYTDGIVKSLTGQSTKPWFRPPFGARNQRVLDVARELGFRSVYWTVDSGDWRTNATPAGVQSHVLRHVGGGAIVVHHLAAGATAQALPTIVEGIQAQGLRIVTVSELLGMQPNDRP